jgi:hypothetical protein
MGEPHKAAAETAPRPKGNPPRRADLSFCHAVESDLGSFTFTVTLGRWQRQHELTNRENRVLRFFAALNRTGTSGFRGTRCSLGALAAAIRRCTEEAASVSTVKRALGKLVEKGYLLKSSAWGKARRFEGNVCRREQICVFTLTEKATRIWSYTNLPRSKRPGEELKKPEPLNRAQSFFDDPASSDRPAEIEAAGNQAMAEPAAPASGDRLTAPSARHEGGKAAAKPAPPPGSIPKPSTEPANSTPKRSTTFRRGEPWTRASAKKAILELLTRMLADKGRPGKVAAALAAFELGGGRRLREEGSGVRWDYWLARWGSLSRAERRSFARVEMLPLLLREAPAIAAPPLPNANRPSLVLPRRDSEPLAAFPLSTAALTQSPTDEDAIASLRNLERLGWPAELVARAARNAGIEDWPQ